jgi:hypothetical protein
VLLKNGKKEGREEEETDWRGGREKMRYIGCKTDVRTFEGRSNGE